MGRVGGKLGVRKKAKVSRSRVQGSPEILKRTRLQTEKEKEKNIKYGFAGGGKDPRLDYAQNRRQQIRENLKLLNDPEFMKPRWRKGVKPLPNYPDWKKYRGPDGEKDLAPMARGADLKELKKQLDAAFPLELDEECALAYASWRA